MARASLPLGTYGKIRTYPQGSGYQARTLYRDWDGVTRHVEKAGRSRAAAERALAESLRDRARVDAADTVTPDTLVSVVAEQWFAELEDKSPSTMQAYRDRLDNQLLPALGSVRVRELTVGLIDRHLTAVKNRNGPAIAKMTKSVLSGVCGLATRRDALASNPCRDASRISTKTKRQPRALSVAEVKRVREWFAADIKANDRDLPDLVAFMVATGLRIGEACAVCWADIDFDAGTVSVRGTVLRLKGQGLIIKPAPKSAAGERILELPSWCIAMLEARRAVMVNQDVGVTSPVFPAPLSGQLRDPSNTRRGLREAFEEMGLPGLTSHTFRKTVATLMDEAGLPARQAADQLGHAKVSITQDTYYGRKVRATGAARVLEALG